MKKIALALVTASAVVLGLGLGLGQVATAQAYDPSITPATQTVAPGASATVTYNNCALGSDVVFTLASATVSPQTVACAAPVGLVKTAAPDLGNATATFTVSTDPGTYDGTAVNAQQEVSLPFEVMVEAAPPTTVPPTTVPPTTPTSVAPTVPSGGLPATGSDGIGTTTGIAIGLLVLGLGLFAVAQVRRRHVTSA